jgi:hypothetical protein
MIFDVSHQTEFPSKNEPAAELACVPCEMQPLKKIENGSVELKGQKQSSNT